MSEVPLQLPRCAGLAGLDASRVHLGASGFGGYVRPILIRFQNQQIVCSLHLSS
jgi:hypothetical protein